MASDTGKEETAMAGKLVIKARLGDDVRVIPIHNEDITYDELILMMQRVYRSTLASSDDLTIKYQDEDGDLITMFDCADLSYALHANKGLKITLFPIPPLSKTKALLTEDGVAVRNELLEIRERIDHLLTCLEEDKRIKTAPVNTTTSKATKSEEMSEGSISGRLPEELGGLNGGKEFDPLSNGSTSFGHTGEAYIPPINKAQQPSQPQQQPPQQQPPQQPQQQPPQQSQQQPPQQPQQQPPQQQPSQLPPKQSYYHAPQQYPAPEQTNKPPQASTTTSSAYPPSQFNPYPQNQPPPSSFNNQPPSSNPSFNNHAPNNYPPNLPPSTNNYPPSQPPSNYNNTSYPSSSSSYQPPQPVQTGVQGGQYNQYPGYKATPTSQPPYQPPFYPQSGAPPSPSNPYARGASQATQYPRPPLYPPSQ